MYRPSELEQVNRAWRELYKRQTAPSPQSSQHTPRPSSPSGTTAPKRATLRPPLPSHNSLNKDHLPPLPLEFNFPEKSYLPGNIRPSLWPNLMRLVPMSDPTTVSEMITSLRNHSINTLAELRRIERILASIGSPEVTEPMTTAWLYYVNSHSFLTELRSLTRNYPFSSECLDEAKRRVLTDPNSNRSWNYCWLVLSKIRDDSLIPSYAHYQASLPIMWGNQQPSPQGVTALASAFVAEWNYATNQMLRHWERAPVGGSST